MKRLKKVIDVVFEMITQKDWDNVLIVGGDEGIGKSSLVLWIMEYYYQLLEGSCNSEHVEKIALSIEQFLRILKDLKQYELINYDEAGELSSLRMMNKFNYAVMKAYEVIRSENLFTILILPDIFYLNPFFSARRARGYIHVYKRGVFAYWNKTNMRRVVEINKTFKYKSVWRVKPLFHDHFPIYKGVLWEKYQEKKRLKTQAVREALYEKIVIEESNQYKELELYYRAYKAVGAVKTAEIFQVTRQTVYNKLKELRAIKPDDVK